MGSSISHHRISVNKKQKVYSEENYGSGPREVGGDFESNLINEHSPTESCLDHFKMKSGKLGAGSYGLVRCAVHKKTGVEVAIKTIKVGNGETWENLLNEVHVMKQLRHPNIVRLYETYKTDESVELVMYKCSGGTLRQFLETHHGGTTVDPLYEQQVAQMMTKVLSAVAYMHHRRVCHRDLKLENIMIKTRGECTDVVVMDFGLGEILDNDDRLTDNTGTLPYMAPEMLQHNVQYDFACDVWAIGVIVFHLLSNTLPFHRGNIVETMNSISHRLKKPYEKLFTRQKLSNRRGELPTPMRTSSVWDNVSKEAKECILQILRFNCVQRPSARLAQKCKWLVLHHNPAEKFEELKKPESKERVGQLVNSLRQFANFRPLQNIALLAAAFGLDESKVGHLMQLFHMLDTDNNVHDGRITLDELRRLMELDLDLDQPCGSDLDEAEVRTIFDALDQDHDGSINWLEFLAASCHAQTASTSPHRKLIEEENWTEAFNLLDVDGVGAISVASIDKMLGDASAKRQKFRSPSGCIVGDFDLNGDGKITLDEFMKMTEKIPEPDPDPRPKQDTTAVQLFNAPDIVMCGL